MESNCERINGGRWSQITEPSKTNSDLSEYQRKVMDLLIEAAKNFEAIHARISTGSLAGVSEVEPFARDFAQFSEACLAIEDSLQSIFRLLKFAGGKQSSLSKVALNKNLDSLDSKVEQAIQFLSNFKSTLRFVLGLKDSPQFHSTSKRGHRLKPHKEKGSFQETSNSRTIREEENRLLTPKKRVLLDTHNFSPLSLHQESTIPESSPSPVPTLPSPPPKPPPGYNGTEIVPVTLQGHVPPMVPYIFSPQVQGFAPYKGQGNDSNNYSNLSSVAHPTPLRPQSLPRTQQVQIVPHDGTVDIQGTSWVGPMEGSPVVQSIKGQTEGMRYHKRGKNDDFEIENDFWHWRKYGQKPIKAEGILRCYFKCGFRMGELLCPAKRQVDRSMSDLSIVAVLYDGAHIHPSPGRRMVVYDNGQGVITTRPQDGGDSGGQGAR